MQETNQWARRLLWKFAYSERFLQWWFVGKVTLAEQRARSEKRRRASGSLLQSRRGRFRGYFIIYFNRCQLIKSLQDYGDGTWMMTITCGPQRWGLMSTATTKLRINLKKIKNNQSLFLCVRANDCPSDYALRRELEPEWTQGKMRSSEARAGRKWSCRQKQIIPLHNCSQRKPA